MHYVNIRNKLNFKILCHMTKEWERKTKKCMTLVRLCIPFSTHLTLEKAQISINSNPFWINFFMHQECSINQMKSEQIHTLSVGIFRIGTRNTNPLY